MIEMRESSPSRPFLWKCWLDKAVDDVRLAFGKHTLDNGQFRCQTNITPTVSDLNPKGKQLSRITGLRAAIIIKMN